MKIGIDRIVEEINEADKAAGMTNAVEQATKELDEARKSLDNLSDKLAELEEAYGGFCESMTMVESQLGRIMY